MGKLVEPPNSWNGKLGLTGPVTDMSRAFSSASLLRITVLPLLLSFILLRAVLRSPYYGDSNMFRGLSFSTGT